MANRYEMRFSGSGGQGVILASVIMAEAALFAGKNTVQSQLYGPEARGGLCKGEAIISTDQIWYTKVTRPNFLLALNQGSLIKFSKDLAEDGVIMIDSSIEIPEGMDADRVISIPIISTARDVVGNVMTANIVAVGAINAALSLFPEEAMKEGLKLHIPKGTGKMNKLALEEGRKLITDETAGKFKVVFSEAEEEPEEEEEDDE